MIYVVATIASLPVEKLYTINVVRPDSQQVQMGKSSNYQNLVTVSLHYRVFYALQPESLQHLFQWQ